MATPIKTKPCMTPEEFVLTFEYRHLTPKMQEWISTYLQGFLDTGKFDVLAATKAAYVCKNDESTRVLGYQITGNPKIILALNRFFGVTQKDLFLKQLERAIYDKKITLAQIRALELAAHANGWTTGLPRHQDLRVKPPAKSRAKSPKVTPADPLARVPEGATPLMDKAGVLRGYKTASGVYVQLADVEAE